MKNWHLILFALGVMVVCIVGASYGDSWQFEQPKPHSHYHRLSPECQHAIMAAGAHLKVGEAVSAGSLPECQN